MLFLLQIYARNNSIYKVGEFLRVFFSFNRINVEEIRYVVSKRFFFYFK